MSLHIQLENGQRVYFNDNGEALQAVERDPPETHLTAWFRWNRDNTDVAMQFHYPDMQMHCTWDMTTKIWNIRKGEGGSVGRVYMISPSMGELFYLRLLLHHPSSIESTSFENVKTIQGMPHDTFRGACMPLGILDDDTERERAMEGATLSCMPSEIS